MSMLVAIPSKGRPGNIPSQTLITSSYVFVPDLEFKAYERLGARNLVSVPNDVRGITPTRNWILKWAKKKKFRHVVFIDDDLQKAGYIELMARHGEHRELSEEQWLNEWEKLFDVTEQAGFRMWGVSTDGALRGVHPYKPFLFKSYITASCMGMINDGKLFFDESYPVKEDYEICLRCVVEDGGLIAARYLYWRNSHWVDVGGFKDYRTQEMERDCIRRLKKQYPGMVRDYKERDNEFCIKLVF